MKRIKFILGLFLLAMIAIIVVIAFKPNNSTKNGTFDKMITDLFPENRFFI